MTRMWATRSWATRRYADEICDAGAAAGRSGRPPEPSAPSDLPAGAAVAGARGSLSGCRGDGPAGRDLARLPDWRRGVRAVRADLRAARLDPPHHHRARD